MAYDFKLFQFPTQTMAREVELFSQNHPGWELVSLTALGLKDLGGGAGSIPLSVLLLARKPATVSIPPIGAVSTVAPSISVPTGVLTTAVPRAPRVLPIAAPVWALGSSYPGAMASAISENLAPGGTPAVAGNAAIMDVVIDGSGAVLLISTHPDPLTAPQLVAEATAAINAASPFMAIPATATINSIADRTFTFSVSP